MKSSSDETHTGVKRRRFLSLERRKFLFVVLFGMTTSLLVSALCTVATNSPFNNKNNCWISLRSIRCILFAQDGVMPQNFLEWRDSLSKGRQQVNLAAQVCAYCKEYANKSGKIKFKIRSVDGVEYLSDPWGRPYNVDMLTLIPDSYLRAALADYSPRGIAMWSSGPNGINEYGRGDDIFAGSASRRNKLEWGNCQNRENN